MVTVLCSFRYVLAIVGPDRLYLVIQGAIMVFGTLMYFSKWLIHALKMPLGVCAAGNLSHSIYYSSGIAFSLLTDLLAARDAQSLDNSNSFRIGLSWWTVSGSDVRDHAGRSVHAPTWGDNSP